MKQMVVRFPVPVVVIVVLTLLFLWLHNGEIPNYSMTMEFLEKSTFSLILVFFFSIGVSFAVASRKFSSVGKLLFQFIPLVF
ncbi:MAG: hypothetical protein LBU27_08240 [Candidatus Peribacteria bacterium]|nr:hypothetical protein [Candidatus Peribacteria bacterium]